MSVKKSIPNFQIIKKLEKGGMKLSQESTHALFTIIVRYEKGKQINSDNAVAYYYFQRYLEMREEKGFFV